MKSQGMLISALVFAFVIALFAVINVESVQVNFLFAKPTMPLILVILASTLLGGLIVGLFGLIRQYKLQRSIKALEKRIAELTAGQTAADEPIATAHADSKEQLEEEEPADKQ